MSETKLNHDIKIVPFDAIEHRNEVIDLWKSVFGYEAAHNDPGLILQKKEQANDDLFFVTVSEEGKLTGTVMCGYDGHRGWIYSLAVLPELQRAGTGTALMKHAETTLENLGCVKINLQIMEGNENVQTFYESIGYSVEKRVSMGKPIKSNIRDTED